MESNCWSYCCCCASFVWRVAFWICFLHCIYFLFSTALRYVRVCVCVCVHACVCVCQSVLVCACVRVLEFLRSKCMWHVLICQKKKYLVISPSLYPLPFQPRTRTRSHLPLLLFPSWTMMGPPLRTKLMNCLSTRSAWGKLCYWTFVKSEWMWIRMRTWGACAETTNKEQSKGIGLASHVNMESLYNILVWKAKGWKREKLSRVSA